MNEKIPLFLTLSCCNLASGLSTLWNLHSQTPLISISTNICEGETDIDSVFQVWKKYVRQLFSDVRKKDCQPLIPEKGKFIRLSPAITMLSAKGQFFNYNIQIRGKKRARKSCWDKGQRLVPWVMETESSGQGTQKDIAVQRRAPRNPCESALWTCRWGLDGTCMQSKITWKLTENICYGIEKGTKTLEAEWCW